jgi:hypothetical protein
MKVANIEETVGGNGNPLWVISFVDKKLTLSEWAKPTFSIGDEYPYETELIKPEKGRWYYKRKGTTTQENKPTEDKPKYTPKTYPKNDDDIMLQVAFKGAIELETHHNPPEGEINTARVIQATSELFAGLILMRPKKG